MTQQTYLPIAVRAHTERMNQPNQDTPTGRNRQQPWQNRWPQLALVLDCETRTDLSQRLTFGFYRIYEGRVLIEEGIFTGDDLRPHEWQRIRDYAATTQQDTVDACEPLVLHSRESFLKDIFVRVAYKARGVVVGFNLPFDLSRLAVHVGKARGRFNGGFSFSYLTYTDERGTARVDRFHPRIRIKRPDSKKAFMEFALPDRGYNPRMRWANRQRRQWRGRFLDLRTLAFALTDRSHTLDSACVAFGVPIGKQGVDGHGAVTRAYLDYARNDVRITAMLYHRIMDEYRRHPIDLPPDKAYSPASIGKAYLWRMGIQRPRLGVDKDTRLTVQQVLGASMESYFGGRAECRVRNVPVPVVYTDYRSMYPTVNTLMGLWGYLTAEAVTVADATRDTQAFLDALTLDDLFNPETWRRLPVLVELVPDRDTLPVRTKYDDARQNYNIGVNELCYPGALWYTLADCIASKLLTGKTPRVRRAIRFIPEGRQRRLRPVKVRGDVKVNPRHDDFFRELIRARGAVRADPSSPEAEREALQRFLKTLASSTSYGIFVELNRQEDERDTVTVYGREQFTCTVEHPEEPGGFYFPPLATLITGAARLMLATAEAAIRERGGVYAFMDTDSVAIVASEHGGLIPCPGGDEKLPDGREAIRALSWADVDQLRERFSALNPYGDASGILEIEDINFTEDVEQRQLWCYAVAAKRYALFTRDGDSVSVQKGTEHGLGAYLSPINPHSQQSVRDWIRTAWEWLIRGALGLQCDRLPEWANTQATTRISISTPTLHECFQRWNEGKPYAEQVKPFNFLHHAALDPVHGRPLGWPKDVPFNLVAPYGERTRWINRHEPNGQRYRVSVNPNHTAHADTVLGRSYRDIIEAHPYHPESKSLGPDGQPCHSQTVGVLRRRTVRVSAVRYIGKEANELEQVDAGLVDTLDEIQTVYDRGFDHDLARVLAEIPTKDLVRETGYSARAMRRIRSGERCPSPERLPILLSIAARKARQHLINLAYVPPEVDTEAVHLYAAFLNEQDAQETLHRETRRAEREYRQRLYAAIHEHGGIGPHRDGTLRTEYQQLPRSIRRAGGPPPDDLAHSLGQVYPEFGIFDEHDLYAVLS
jgi:hypothetical protein